MLPMSHPVETLTALNRFVINETDQLSSLANAFFNRYDEICRDRYENAAQPQNATLATCPDLYKVADLLTTRFAIHQTFGVRHPQ